MAYKSIELFAGAGGLALGLEQAGFEHIGLVEFDKYAAETLKYNRPNWNVLCEDVEVVSSRDLEKEFGVKKGELDVLSGGAPCQSFSYAGKRLGLEDVRGTMFYHYATFLHKLQPKIFLFENVKGLLTHEKGETYKTILGIFEDEGYTTTHEVMNAWDYGVAQKRERLITIGIRKDLAERANFKFPRKYDYKPVLRDILQDVPESECANYSEQKRKVFALVPPGGYWKDIDPKIAKEYMKTCWDMGGGRTGILRRLSFDEPSLTVLTTPQMKQTDRCHPSEVRPFSIRENARIQSFPDEWEFKGSIGAKYRQIGNAVPCNLAKEIGISIINTLEGVEEMYNLSFISEEDFECHVTKTIESYNNTLKSINLDKFNSNIIDPIKLIFDKNVFKKSFEEIIELEIHRQRDKSNTNAIGYFHQNIFKYIDNCEVPNEGWDIIVTMENNSKIYVEMKNKHNTMNSSSSQKTYIEMQNKIMKSPNERCFLVEVLAPVSRDIVWGCSVNKKHVEDERIRRVSIDKFYEIVTGDSNAFYNMCMQLPNTIEKIIASNKVVTVEKDSVIDELRLKNPDMLKSLYMLAFKSYEGFKNLE
ncbi:Eco47II family restriction endonuclease [Clostridioides difficile]|uniref:Eco47II family restriction endonuclease n=1 Tax=Clostridioides difficile TaxID=1496 RepID=UPI000D1F9EB1|nr:Eco47II family restriction endonuclease [Clostridioides difficile]